MRIKKLPARSVHFILPLLITFFMTCVVSCVSTVKNLGFGATNFYGAWMEAWGASWVIAFPTLIILLPLVRRLVFSFVEAPGR